MQQHQKYILLFALLNLLLFLLFFINIGSGSVPVPTKEVFSALFGGTVSKLSWKYIIIHYRLPKAVTAILSGISLSVSGLLMQTLFRNPLAGPDVLGLHSGAGLGVAFVLMGAIWTPTCLSTFLYSPYGITIAACTGCLLVLLAILIITQKINDTMAILIIGLMFGSFTSAFINILSFFSSATQLQKFHFWALGSLSDVSWLSIVIIGICCIIGLLLSLFSIKALDALLLGENYAKSLGVHFKNTRILLIVATTILTGSTTAFVGPISFIGLTVPHIAKLVFRTSNHTVLFWATLLFGAIILLFCDTVAQLPGTEYTLPINVITSIIGSPIVIWLLIDKRKKRI